MNEKEMKPCPPISKHAQKTYKLPTELVYVAHGNHMSEIKIILTLFC